VLSRCWRPPLPVCLSHGGALRCHQSVLPTPHASIRHSPPHYPVDNRIYCRTAATIPVVVGLARRKFRITVAMPLLLCRPPAQHTRLGCVYKLEGNCHTHGVMVVTGTKKGHKMKFWRVETVVEWSTSVVSSAKQTVCQSRVLPTTATQPTLCESMWSKKAPKGREIVREGHAQISRWAGKKGGVY